MDNDTKIRFADIVLSILERDTDWDADTIDEIGNSAIALGLAHTDDEAYFTLNQ